MALSIAGRDLLASVTPTGGSSRQSSSNHRTSKGYLEGGWPVELAWLAWLAELMGIFGMVGMVDAIVDRDRTGMPSRYVG
jgi:hypothetical protein